MPNESINRLRHARCHLMDVRLCQRSFEAGLDEHMHVRRSTLVDTPTLAHTWAAVAWHCHCSSENKPCRSFMHYPLQTGRAQCNRNLPIKMDSFSTLCIYRRNMSAQREREERGRERGEGIRGGGVGNNFHGMSLPVCENAHNDLTRNRQYVLNWEWLLLGLSWQPLKPTSTTTRTPPHFFLSGYKYECCTHCTQWHFQAFFTVGSEFGSLSPHCALCTWMKHNWCLGKTLWALKNTFWFKHCENSKGRSS